MKPQFSETQLGRSARLWGRVVPGFLLGAGVALLAAPGAPGQAAPMSDLSFSEGSGLTTTNAGSLGGLGAFAQQAGYPIFAPNAPVGAYAPAGNGGAVDFGAITGGSDGGRAVDFPGALGPLNGFTVCGWVNCRDLTVGWGGNRIAFALVAPNSSGFDLVHLADGSLQLGVNQWPDGVPAVSSAGRITADPNVGVANWVFFAVTYDGTLSSGQVNFYFGNGETPAALDVTRDYNRGALPACGSLTLGNFGTVSSARNETGPAGGSRCFRGLMDEVQVFPEVLTLEQIRAAQTRAALPPSPLAFVSEPVDRAVLAGQPATFAVAVSGGFPITYRWQRNEEDLTAATNASYTVPAASVADSGSRFRVIVTNPINSLTSSNATLLVNSDGDPPAVVQVTAPSLTNLIVRFSEPVEAGSAQESVNYSLAGGNLSVFSAVLQGDLTNVVLTTDPMTPGAEYTLTVSSIADRALPVPNQMDETNVTFTAYTPPPFPTPLVELRLNEGAGTTTTNLGAAGGTLALSTPVPVWSANIPGNMGGASSVDFGTSTGNYYVESTAVISQLAGLTQFTIAGWVNNRSSVEGGGGNRIVTWNSPNSDGVDLVYKTDGSLQIGINQWPDNVPARSSAGKITTDANAGLANWRFFAVTYDSTLASDQVKFYFGSIAADAVLDVATTYARGAVGPNIKPLVLGHFNNSTRPGATDRMFRGLIDEVQIFGAALTAEEIVRAQRAHEVVTPLVFVSEPVTQAVLAGRDATFSVAVTGGFPITYQWQRNEADILDATNASYTVVAPTVADSGARFRVVVTNPVSSLTSSNALLLVNSDGDPPVVVGVTAPNLTNVIVSFSEPVEVGTAQEAANYTLAGGSLSVLAALLQANLTNVTLTTEAMVPGADYTLTIAGIADRAAPVPNQMDQTNVVFTTPIPPVRTAAMIEARFEEGTGHTVANTGTVGGLGTIDFGLASSATGLPAFSNNVPAGPFAPGANRYSLNFGTSAGHTPYAGKAVDFPDSVRSNTVGLTQFTLTGWINATDGTIGGGGNRIFTTWPQNVGGVTANRLTGVDLVVESSGRLRLGVNQAPDFPTPPTGPFSSANRVTISSTANPTNWVFFAVTYDASLGADHVKYYFGNATTAASFDLSASYPRGLITNCTVPVTLTLGNFMDTPPLLSARDSTSSSRVFRGLMDEIRFFAHALTLEEIRQIQTTGGEVVATPPGIQTQPASVLTFEGQPAAFSIVVTGTPPLSLQWQRDGADLSGATNLTLSLPGVSLADDGAVFRLVVTNAQGTAISSNAVLTVLPEDGRKIVLNFEEGAGLTTTNLGNLLGYASFVQRDSLPVFSSNVPVGPYAPAANSASVDFGTISAGQGGRAIDWGHGLTPTLGVMQGFTVCGWVNVRDLTVGFGGNRIAFALDAENGRGFDLVHLADGSLRVGINQWPDSGTGGPFSSAGKLTADANAGAANWVFLALTYDSTLTNGQAKYYFGKPDAPVALDVVRDYNRGIIAASGPLTLGNFGVVAGARNDTGSSRVFRGLMDNIQVHNRVLSLCELQAAQRGLPVLAEGPELTIRLVDGQVEIRWDSACAFQLEYTEALGSGEWHEVTTPPSVVGTLHTVTLQAEGDARFYRLKSQ
jgi:hypothetical protein